MSMSIVQESIVCRFFLTIWSVLAGAWQDSRVGSALREFGRRFAQAVRGSAVCQFVWREGTLPRLWPEIVTCSLLTVVV